MLDVAVFAQRSHHFANFFVAWPPTHLVFLMRSQGVCDTHLTPPKRCFYELVTS